MAGARVMTTFGASAQEGHRLACMRTLFPFTRSNVHWAEAVAKVYFVFALTGLVLSAIFFAVEQGEERERALRFEDSLWFVWCTFHGTGFGDVHPKGAVGRIVAMMLAFLGYWFVLFAMCAVMLSQLAAEPTPTLRTLPKRIFNLVWPSMLVVGVLIMAVGLVAPGLEGMCAGQDTEDGCGWDMGAYFAWCVMWRSP